jgi:ATP-dependent helicase/nuclease subunit B
MKPEPVFIGWDAPLLPRVAELLLEPRGQDLQALGIAGGDDSGVGTSGTPTIDLRGLLLVLPGRRARHRLMECLASAARARGVTLIPPRATTVGQVIEILYPPERARASREAQVRSWALALLETGARALEPAFPHLSDDTLRSRRDALARLLVDLRADLAQEGHDLRDVARVSERWDDFQDNARWEVLARVEERARALLAEADLEDPWEARRRLASAPPTRPGHAATGGALGGPSGGASEIWLVGLAELPGVTRRILEASGATLRSVIHGAPDGGGARAGAGLELPASFDAWGIPTPGFWSEVRIPLGEAQIHAADRPVDQARAVVQILKGIHPTPQVDEVVVAVSQGSDVLPYLDHQLGNEGIRTRVGAGRPLTSTEPVRLLQALGDFLDTHRWDSLAALLRHPASRGLLAAAGVQGDLAKAAEWADEWFTHHLPYRLDGTLPVEEADADPRALERRAPFGSLVRTLRRDGPLAALSRGDKAPLSTWMPRLMDVLLSAYGSHRFGQDASTGRRLLRALDAVRDGAEALRVLPAPLDEPVSGAEALQILLAGLQGGAVPMEADPEAVELLDWLEVVVDDAPVVIVTGFNEGKIPASQVGDALLPDRLRTHLGLPDNARRLGRDAYRLVALLHSCPKVHVIVGRTSAAGDPLRPSRLLFQTDPLTAARRVQALLAPAGGGHGASEGGTSRGGTPPQDTPLLPRHIRPGARTGFSLPPEPVIEVAPGDLPDSLAITQFKTLLQDPYRFALATLLKLEPMADDAREMDGRLFGVLAHDILEGFGRQAVSDPGWSLLQDAGGLGDHLVGELRARVRRQFGTHPLPAVRLQCAQLEGRLRAFARAQVEWSAQGWQIRSVEGKLEEGGYPFHVDGVPFFLKGRIDRIDYHPADDRWAVLDYKTSASATTPEKAHRTRDGGWKDLQLPLYRHLALGIRDDADRPVLPGDAVVRGKVKVGYVVVPQDPAATALVLADWDEGDLASADDRAREAIRILRSGVFPFEPERARRSSFQGDAFAPLLGTARGPDEDDETENEDGEDTP